MQERLPVIGAYVRKLQQHRDDRGIFEEIYRKQNESNVRTGPTRWEQVSVSTSAPNVLRGIHVSTYGKLVTCTQGMMHDYVVDFREDSATYLQWCHVVLTAAGGEQVYIPAGCGHAYFAGKEGCMTLYLQEGTYDPATEKDALWNDPVLGIKWPFPKDFTPVLSEKDRNAKPLSERCMSTLPASGPRVLVVGASGQLGAALVEQFGQRNCIGTYNTVQTDPAYIHLDLEDIAADATLGEAWLERIHPDVLCICAAFTWVDGAESQLTKAFSVNATAPAHLAAAAQKLKIQTVFISTDYLFDGEDGPYDETAVPNPVNVYGMSKLEGEQKVLAACPSALIVRTTTVFGPEQQTKNFVSQVNKALAVEGNVFRVPNDQLTTPTYSKDLALVTRKLLATNASGIFHVVGPETMSKYEFAVKIATHAGLDVSMLQAIPTDSFCQKAKRPLKGGLTCQKLVGVLPDVTVRTVEEALSDWNPKPVSYYSSNQSTESHGKKKVWYAPHTFEAYGEEEIAAVEECLRRGWLAPGALTAEFESRVASYFGKKCGVMVNSGSSANLIGLAVFDLARDDEIVTPACTFSTCIAPMEQLGLKPIFVDVEVGRYVPSNEAMLAAVTPKTKMMFIPNLIGSKVDWEGLKASLLAMNRPDIILFEDSCDTMTYTECTDVSVISFYASHIITAGGCGGVVMFNDTKLRDRALMYRDWGRIGNNTEDMSERFGHCVDGIPYDFKFLYGCIGYNFKCSEMNAAFGLKQLDKLPRFTKMRADNINRYVENLRQAGTGFVLPVGHEKYDWLALPLMHSRRLELLKYLEENEVQVRVCFAGNITRHPAYRHYLQDFPGSDRIMAEGFLLGAHHGLKFEDIDRVCDLLIRFDKGIL
eukprot:CAMPEP_0118932070 /NCGR_PEP_ID=MMETSP1169-20130426/8996_1 /TAXON_ID=36882 /ORGANISM="Pyramimonas obovata, Strain CCMP722" /LENGTH=873 /DNA_ID=CAMNT_0006874667 /DNA_START=50 /DNA_END=2671 /DNA_ORIENTATION=+